MNRSVVALAFRWRHRTLRRIPALLRRRRRAVGWSDVLLDAIGVGWKAPNALWDGCPGTMTGVLIEGASPRKSIALTKLRLRECTFSVVVTE